MDRKNHSKVARGGEPAQFLLPRLVAVVGHYGSGKTTVAVNMAMRYARAGERVAVVDFDIVNPYFRTADSRDMLESAGVHCVVPPLANTNVDVPALPAEIYSLFAGSGGAARFDRVIFDVGGDDGAVALSAYRAHFYREPHALLYVVSMYRPLTATPEAAAELLGEIEARSGLRATHVVNNSSLGAETTAGHVISSLDYAHRVCELCGLPLLSTAVMEDVASSLDTRAYFVMKNYTKRYF
ncbi:MAG: ParA family protein [Clostridiales bacterium]|jgi:energy-coupling factor transporter ATP-binding protein EcfA2|nr:ParA family protein [Clostridiales bacterium]